MGRTFRLVLVALLLGVCGAASSPSATGEPSSVPPERIVSLSPAATEILFAIGAGDQVVAVDDASNYPPEAPRTTLSGYTVNLEALQSYDPDLVVYADDSGSLAGSLEATGLTGIHQPAAESLTDTYDQILELGELTGHAEVADVLVEEMKDRIREVAASASRPGRPLTYYHELDENYYSATSNTFLGSVYALLGLTNIADPADSTGSGYPQLSAEYIVKANPDVIFLADTKCCSQSAATVAARPGWSGIAAVTSGKVVELDDDIASRWGPRVVDFLEQAAEALEA